MLTFTVLAGGDDGDIQVNSNVSGGYPPTGTPSPYTPGATFTAGRRLAFNQYRVLVGLVRFDTSALPDNATITGATLKLYVNAKADGDNRNVVGEWYAASNWPIDAADYTATPSSTALAGADITAITTSAVNSLALQNVSNVSTTSYTGFRLHVDGGVPAADNYVQFSSFEGGNVPQLVVTYTVP